MDIVAIDDAGERFGPVTLSLDALEAVNFDAVDLEEGNTEANLSGGVGDGEGNWHLELDTTLDIEALAYIRSVGRFLEQRPRCRGRRRVAALLRADIQSVVSQPPASGQPGGCRYRRDDYRAGR